MEISASGLNTFLQMKAAFYSFLNFINESALKIPSRLLCIGKFHSSKIYFLARYQYFAFRQLLAYKTHDILHDLELKNLYISSYYHKISELLGTCDNR